MKIRGRNLLKSIFFLALIIIFWWQIYSFHFWPEWLFPSPLTVAKTLTRGFLNQTFIWGILISLRRLFIGFGISVLIGTMLGFLTAKVKLFREAFGFLLLGLQTLPSICWLPLALLWFGLNERAIIFVIVMGAFLSVALGVESAVKNVPPTIINAGKMLGARGVNLYRYVILPAILPSYLNSLKQGWSFAWRSLMSGEMLFITVGLGQLLMFGRELNDMAQVMAVMIVIIMIGVVFDRLIFLQLEKGVRQKWGLEKR